MSELIATTAQNIKGLGNSSQGQRSTAPKKAVVVMAAPMTEEQALKCERKQIEAAQYAKMGMKRGCNGM